MHILILVHDLQPGGAERIALRLGSEWARTGQQVTLFCGEAEGPLRPLLDESVRLIASGPPVRRSPGSRFRLGKAAARLVRQDRPDLILLPGNYYFDAAIALKRGLGSSCPPIVGKISNALRRPDKSWAGQAAYSAWFAFKSLFVDHIVTMSPGLLAEARRSVPGGATKFSTIPQPVLGGAVEHAAEQRSAAAGEGLRLVAAGRLAPQKNFPLLVEAFDRVRRNRDATLDIFGEGPLRPALEAQIARLGRADRVRLRGYVPSLAEHLGAYDLFVLSSDFEGFPSVLVEALAAGIPVVTTDCSPAIADLVVDEAFGAVVPVRDADALAEAVVQTLDGGVRDSERLRHSVRAYRLDSSARHYLDLFHRILRSDGAVSDDG